MMKGDPRVKMLNLIRVSIKMNNNERTLAYQNFLSLYISLNEISKAYHLQLVTQHFVSQNLL